MRHDDLFTRRSSRAGGFEFDAEVAQVFDDMLVRSIPFYLEQQCMLRDLALKFWIPGTAVYDLGCATGTTLITLAGVLEGAELHGYDNSQAMLDQARRKIEECQVPQPIALHLGDLNGDLAALSLENASIVLMCWTLQFIRPLQRDRLVRWIYEGLASNGALLVTEKILTGNTSMNRFFIELYYDLKQRNGYSQNEITLKRESLENVLIPYSIDENLELFRRNGFEIAETFFQWYNFAGLLCVKK
jgi:tRNA (cmo5U34)-methyltransferase